MRSNVRKSEVALILCFLGIIFAVPAAQTGIELRRGQRVQATDVFRTRPTAANLREYERTLEEKSVFQQQLRPQMQRLLFATLHDTGAKAILGRDDWFFFRPDVRYVVEPDRLEIDTGSSAWVAPSDHPTRRESVVRAIVRFRDQLRERGIQLLVVPVPGKPSVYPDKLTGRAAGQEVDSPTLALIHDLRGRGVETVDLFSAFRAARRQNADLYLARDTHWTPQGVAAAAHTVSQHLAQLTWIQPGSRVFSTRARNVTRHSDILDMTQIPGIDRAYSGEQVECTQVIDPAKGLLIPAAADRPGTFKYPAQQSPILVLGDSFCRIYQFAEPRSLGESDDPTGMSDQTKRLLPGSAGFISHLALSLKTPVDAIVSDGGASTDVRRKLNTNPEILEGKEIVVWEFVERDIALGRAGWEDVPLPVRLGE
ncbi:MAG: hypothetical protein ABSH20_14315 [Tepidisphaeraceae bacterium]|jgi:hypothetical protein